MTRLSLALCSLVLAALPSSAALADTLSFDFSFSNADYSGSGEFKADTTSTTGVYQIVGVGGSVITGGILDEISGLLPAGAFPADGPNDNLLYFPELAAPFGAFDISGVSFLMDNGAKVNLFLANGEVQKRKDGKQDEQSGAIWVVAAVPEPGSLVLLGTGVVALAGVVRRRFTI
jgi:hypothetical protein